MMGRYRVVRLMQHSVLKACRRRRFFPAITASAGTWVYQELATAGLRTPSLLLQLGR